MSHEDQRGENWLTVLLPIPIAVYLLMLRFSVFPDGYMSPDSFILPQVSTWPAYLWSYLPADFVLTAFFAGLSMWFAFRLDYGLNPIRTTRKDLAGYAGKLFLIYGGMFGLIGAAGNGWFNGLEMFLIAGTFAVALLMPIVLGIRWVGRFIIWWQQYRADPEEADYCI